MALIVHPDKNQDDPNAGEKFRNLNNAYKVLIDDEKRALYDETGEYDENESGTIDLDNTYQYYRLIYPKIKLEDIDSYAKKYRGSEMEKEDLVNFYNDNNGNIMNILMEIPLSRNEDVERFIIFYDEEIKSGRLKKRKKYTSSKNNIILLEEDEDESNEAESEMLKLQQQIMLNKQKRNNDDYFLKLAKKYGNEDEYNKYNDIDEKEFKQIQKKLKKKKKINK